MNARGATILVLMSSLASGCITSKPAAGAGSKTDRYVVIAARTPFYKYGPAQGLGPDFVLTAGQPLKLLQRDFGYSRVETDNGRTGYVSTEDIAPAPAAPPAPSAPKPRLSKSRQPLPPDFSQPNDVELPSGPTPVFRY